MAVFNEELYVAQAIESILAQTFDAFEFIIVDDGSTDSTPAILREFSQRDARIKLIRQENCGLATALNTGVEAAAPQAAILARMDADDVALPDRFAAQWTLMQDRPDVVAAGCWTQMIDPDGFPIYIKRWPEAHDEIEQTLLTGEGLGGIAHPGAIIRRNAFDQVGGYDKTFTASQDADLWLRLAEVGQLTNVPQVLLQYRLHLNSVSMTRRREQIDCHRRAIVQACKRRNIATPDLSGFDAAGEVSAQRSSREIRKGWIYNSLYAHNRKTARRHAHQLIREFPLSIDAWVTAWRVWLDAMMPDRFKKSP